MTPELSAILKDAEGLRLTAYRDTLGFWTVGYGHRLADGKSWDGYTVNQDTANGLLIIDGNAAMFAAAKLPEWSALDTPARKDALTEMIFNIGEGGWRKFVKTRAAISDSDWKSAHDNLLNSLWATQVGSSRSGRIADQFLKGEYV